MPSRAKGTRRLRPANSSMAVLIPITYDSLRRCLEGNTAGERVKNVPLLVDCRSPAAYAAGHISGAVNVHPPYNLRRVTKDILPLWTLFSDESILERLANNTWSSVVVYEHHGLSSLEDSSATFVARCLQAQSAIEHVYLLEGGFHRFLRCCPHLCTLASPFGEDEHGGARSASGGASPLLSPKSEDSPNSRSDRSPISNISRNCSSCCSSGASSVSPFSFSFEQESPVEILSYLYLGSAGHASSKDVLQKLGITALLNVSYRCPNHFEDSFIYKSIPIEDSGNEDISIWFREAFDFIDGIKELAGKVLVHCEAGISRSATICMAYIMVYSHMRMEDAYKYIKSRRKVISPNFTFMGQLLHLESQIFPTEKPNVHQVNGEPENLAENSDLSPPESPKADPTREKPGAVLQADQHDEHYTFSTDVMDQDEGILDDLDGLAAI